MNDSRLEFIEVAHDSPLYHSALELRDKVLRQPLGLSVYDEDLAAEAAATHFALADGERVFACLIALPLGDGRYRLRQMAVSTALQGRGLGRRLVALVELALRQRDARELLLHARDGAIGFYEKVGYSAVGEPFVEVDILHRTMTKRLQ